MVTHHPRTVTYHPKDGHPPSQGESQSISRLSVSVLTNSMVSDLVLRLRLRWFQSQTQSQKLRQKEYQARSRSQKSKHGLTDHWHNFGQLQPFCMFLILFQFSPKYCVLSMSFPFQAVSIGILPLSRPYQHVIYSVVKGMVWTKNF